MNRVKTTAREAWGSGSGPSRNYGSPRGAGGDGRMNLTVDELRAEHRAACERYEAAQDQGSPSDRTMDELKKACEDAYARLEEAARRTQPAFAPGDRVFTHYDMDWGTIKRLASTDRDRTHGVTGTPLDDTTWYEVEMDKGGVGLYDDAHGNWDMARIVPPRIARRYGYGDDPKSTQQDERN